MHLRLSKYIEGNIKILSLDKSMKYTKKIIKDLEKLYNIENLDDEELKKLITKYYEFNFINNYEDLEKLSKSILKWDDLKEKSISTIILIPPKYYKKRIDVSIIYKSQDKLKDSYSINELRNLVNMRKIVIKNFDCSNVKISPEYDHLLEIPQSAITSINERNFGSYEDIILKLVRKNLQKTQVNRDIKRIINIMRTKNYQEGFNYFKNLYTLDCLDKGIIRKKFLKKFDK